MKSTERKASAGMIKFVVTLIGLAFVVTTVYFVFLAPGVPQQGQPATHAIDQNGG